MNKEDKFIVTDATDIICIGGFGNDLGNIGLLKYNEQEIANMMIENNTQVDDIRLVNSLLNTIKKYKEVIDKAIDYAENRDLLYLANKCSVIYGDNVEVVSISDILNDLLTKLK